VLFSPLYALLGDGNDQNGPWSTRKPCYRKENRAMSLQISIRIEFYNKSSWPNHYSILFWECSRPFHQIAHVGVSPSVTLKLFGREIIFQEFQPVWKTYLNVTDGRTDRRTDDILRHNCALRSIARGKNSLHNFCPLFQFWLVLGVVLVHGPFGM